jgi:hypothetical protein
MEKEIQISAPVSRATKDLLDRHVRATGIKKGRLLEDAVRHHLTALASLPADVIIHPTLVVTRASGKAVLKQVKAGKANAALRKLMRDGD